MPARVQARLAAAIAPPAFDAVDAAPGGVLEDLDLMLGRMLFQELAVDGQLGQPLGLQDIEAVGQGHVPEPVMMPVGLSVGGDVNELRSGSVLDE